MSLGLFVLDNHPDKLRIFVGGGVNEESIRVAMRAACYKRRTMVKNDSATWLVYLLRELRKLSKYVRVATGLFLPEGKGLLITIANTRKAVHLRILDCEKLHRVLHKDEATEPTLFDGSFFAFLGNSEATITRGRGGNRMRRQGRLDWFREQYKAKHGYYPHEETPDSPKRYNPLQTKLNKQHKARLRKVRRIKESIESGKKRKELVKKLGVRFSKFNIKDHYQEPPDSTKADE